MRLRTMLIERYGNFEHASLSFDPAPGQLNLLVAPNGAGKSVLRRAFHDLLFGIPLQSDMRFRFDYPGMHLRAEAVAADGSAFSFGWQRKPGRVFPDAGSEAVAGRWLKEVLEAITPRQVEQLFALDTERLRKGGLELATGDGTLGSALLSGTGELASARKLRRSLDERRAAIWEKGKSSRPLNQSVARFGAAVKQGREALQTTRVLAAQLRAIEDAKDQQEHSKSAYAAAQSKLSRLNRIELSRGPLQALAAAEEWLRANPDAPVLPSTLADDLVERRQAVSLAAHRLEDARLAYVGCEARLAASERDPAAEMLATELAALAGAAGDARIKLRDVREREAERAQVLGAVAAALRDIGSKVRPEDAGSVIPALPAMAAAREQIKRRAAIDAGLAAAQERLTRAKTILSDIALETPSAPEAVPPGLAPLLLEIRRDRDPLRHAADVARAARDARAAADAVLARAGWPGEAAGLIALSTPSEARLERLAAALSEAEQRLAAARAEHRRAAEERAECQNSLAVLRRNPLPDAAALAAARAHRDAGWRLIYARAFAGSPDEASERAFAGEEAVAIAFERALRAADGLADARITEISRVEQAAQLSARLEASEPAWQAAIATAAQAERERQTVAEEWAALCQPLRLPRDATLLEVTTALADRRAAIDAHFTADQAADEQRAIAATHDAWASRLAHLLGGSVEPLASLLLKADARLVSEAAAQTAAVARDTRRADAETERRTAVSLVSSAEEASTAWRAGWETTLAALGRPAGEAVAVTEAVLGRMIELDRDHRRAADFGARVAGMQADIAAFEACVADLAARLGMVPGDNGFSTAEALLARRDRALGLASAAREAELSCQVAAEQVQQREAEQRQAMASLTAVFAATGTTDADAAERRIIAARHRAYHEAARTEALARLGSVATGRPIAVLTPEAATLPAEQYAVEQQAAEVELANARQSSEALAIELAALEQRFAMDAAETGASEAADSQAAIAAEAGRLLDEYLVLRVASGLLGRALDRVEESAGPTGMQRIARRFEAITNGAWTVRAGETTRGETLLLAQEFGMAEPAKLLEQLSEGTRDQLYLALRFVAIEDHVASAPALPFIADDILQTFDDQRARAALAALVELSHHVQVIVLSHHPHIVSIAEGLPMRVQYL